MDRFVYSYLLESITPRQPLTGDLKMLFRFGARIFNTASNLTSKWTPVFLLLAGILVIIDKFLWLEWGNKSGKGIHKNLQAKSK